MYCRSQNGEQYSSYDWNYLHLFCKVKLMVTKSLKSSTCIQLYVSKHLLENSWILDIYAVVVLKPSALGAQY